MTKYTRTQILALQSLDAQKEQRQEETEILLSSLLTSVQNAFEERQKKEERKEGKHSEAIRKALSEGNDAISFIIDLAILNGMSEKNATLHNAKSFIESDYINTKAALETINKSVKDAGYPSVPDLLRRTQYKTGGALEILTYLEQTFNIDTSFLDVSYGDKWDKLADTRIDDLVKRKRLLDAKIATQRNMVKETYIFCMNRVRNATIEENLDEETTKEAIFAWHNLLVEDFHDIDAEDFYDVYKGKYTGIQFNPEIPKPSFANEDIPLIEAIPLCAGFPENLIESFTSQDLGTVSSRMFSHWDTAYGEIANQQNQETKSEMHQELSREILKRALINIARSQTENPLEWKMTNNPIFEQILSEEIPEGATVETLLQKFLSHPATCI